MNYQVDNSKYWNTIIREFRQSEVYNVSYYIYVVHHLCL